MEVKNHLDAVETLDLADLSLDGIEFVSLTDGLAFPEGGASCCSDWTSSYSCCCSSSSCCN